MTPRFRYKIRPEWFAQQTPGDEQTLESRALITVVYHESGGCAGWLNGDSIVNEIMLCELRGWVAS